MSYTPNEIALLTFIKRVNETFSYFGEDGADYVSAEDMDYFKECCLNNWIVNCCFVSKYLSVVDRS